MFIDCYFLNDVLNMSDHKPVRACINFNVPIQNSLNFEAYDDMNELKTINLPPNLENIQINTEFSQILLNQMKQYENSESESEYDKQNTINIIYRQLTDSIKKSYDTCSTTMTVNEYNK
jgi:hypothetical protein